MMNRDIREFMVPIRIESGIIFNKIPERIKKSSRNLDIHVDYNMNLLGLTVRKVSNYIIHISNMTIKLLRPIVRYLLSACVDLVVLTKVFFNQILSFFKNLYKTAHQIVGGAILRVSRMFCALGKAVAKEARKFAKHMYLLAIKLIYYLVIVCEQLIKLFQIKNSNKAS